MTVLTTTAKSGPYAGAGTTGPFTVGFRFLDNAHLRVVKTSAAGVESTLALNTDYTVTGAGGTTGTVTLTAALAVGEKLTIIRNVPATQEADYVAGDAFPAESHETALDKLTMLVQQLVETAGRALTAPVSAVVSTTLPYPEANKVIAWNESASALQNLNPSALATIVAFGTAVSDVFTGDGSTTVFTLSQNPGALANLDVAIGGVTQTPGIDFTWSGGTSVTFTTAPANGVKILARYIQALPQGATNANLVSVSDAGALLAANNVEDALQEVAAPTFPKFTAAGTGAVTRTVQSVLRERISVKDYGAVGDGVTDDTAAIQAAATAAGYGGALFFPKGTYFVSSTITLRGATKLLGEGVEATVIYRTGNYGDTFVCGTPADQSEPARSFEARKICFKHSANYVSGSSTLSDKATSGAHIKLYGAQEAMIYDCWFWRLPYQIISYGGSWVKIINCQFQGVYDSETVALQEGIAHVAALYNSVHGNPTTWIIKGCNFLGATRTRDITYSASSGNVVVNRVDTIGPLYGLYIDGLEDADISGNYFGGQSVAEVAVINNAAGAVIDLRIARNFFDGIARGQGILFAPVVSNTYSLGVTIEGNIFTDNKNAIFINQNAGSSTPSVYNLAIRGNVCLSGIGSQMLIAGAKGFVCSGNSISDYNKHAISTTDSGYTGAIVAYSSAANGIIEGNTIGGGGNTLTNTTGTNYCYVGVSIASTLTSVIARNNFYSGIRSGSNFRTGTVADLNQYTITNGSYQMISSDSVVLVNNVANANTATALPLYPCEGREIIVKDAKGNAASFTTTITTNDGTTIDGAATYVISTNYGYVRLRFNGTSWNRIG